VTRALDQCRADWQSAYDLAQSKGLAPAKAVRMAAVAYKLAMPKMDNLPAIRAAIACIAQGITLEVFDGRDGSQLLYAAQVALATLKAKGVTRQKGDLPMNQTHGSCALGAADMKD
jgi:hypothetical protein